jgi:hypothetical protein
VFELTEIYVPRNALKEEYEEAEDNSGRWSPRVGFVTWFLTFAVFAFFLPGMNEWFCLIALFYGNCNDIFMNGKFYEK